MEPQELNQSFGAEPSRQDYRTVRAEDMATAGLPAPAGKVALDYDFVNSLSNQGRLGICTMCAVRMAAENFFKDGVQLDEYWGYLIGKTLVDGNLNEGSSAFAMLKGAYKYGIPTKAVRAAFPLKTDGTYADFIRHFNEQYGGQVPQAILNNASQRKIPGYYQVALNPFAIAKEIEAGKLPIIRMVVGENFYTSPSGWSSWKAQDLLPLRTPRMPESGHLMVINEYAGLDENQLEKGPNSWGREWADNGYFSFVFKTHAPYYFTEAWGISGLPPEVVKRVLDLPEAKNFRHRFTAKIERGQTGEEVRALQIALSILGFLHVQVDELGNYGPKTAVAVLAYQKARKLLPDALLEANGGNYVHGLTLGALNRDFNS